MTGHRTGPSLPYGRLRIRRRDLAARRPWRYNGRSWVHQFRRRDSESSVDDLGTWRGVVLGRAVTTLRSVETQPYAWGFVLSVRRGPTETGQVTETGRTHATGIDWRSTMACKCDARVESKEENRAWNTMQSTIMDGLYRV